MTDVGNERPLPAVNQRDASAVAPSARALALLLAGHRHYRTEGRPRARTSEDGFVAAVLSCAEPHVPADVLFGGLDVYAVRTAGLRTGPAVIGSIEYAVDGLGLPLVVVLGHSGCGLPAGSGPAQVRATATALRHGSRLLDAAVTDGRCGLVGMCWHDEHQLLSRILPVAVPPQRHPRRRPPSHRTVRRG
ncbi:carbonic anhydrase [Micromonospora chalcea]|uniref:carbonic anhydrase n=1 Tax=Micromonospora chalcea TaxID=1874 RepID=UPI00382B8BB3